MEAINSLLSQELQAKCRYKKDGATVEFTATLPQGPESKVTESVLQKKIERIIKTTQISDGDLPGEVGVVWVCFLFFFVFFLFCFVWGFFGCLTTQQHRECTLGSDLLRHFYVLPHWGRSFKSILLSLLGRLNLLSHTQSHCTPGQPVLALTLTPGVWPGSHQSASF